MALIDVYGAVSNTYKLRIVVTETTKEAGSATYPGGRTMLTSVLRLYCGGQYFQSYTCSGNHKVGGSTLWTASGQYSLPSANSSIVLDTSTKWIVHSSDGTASVSVSGAFQTVDQTPSYKCPPITVSSSASLTPNTVYTPPAASVIVPTITLPTTLASFTSSIQNIGLVAGTASYSGVNISYPGQVSSYSPSAGSTVTAGSSVTPTCYLIQNAVPDLTGQTLATATTTLSNAGFYISSTTTPTTNQSLNNTVSDWGYKGQTINIGTTVNVVVYAYQSVTVPNVIGYTQTAAVTALTNAGLASPTISYDQNGATQSNSGTVKSQTPTGGSSAPSASATSLSIYSYPGASIPNVVGSTVSSAQTTLVNGGFATPTITYTTVGATSSNSGTVKSQSPVAGTIASPGSATSIVIFVLPGKRMTSSSAKVSLTVAKRYANDTDGWIPITTMKRFNGTSWLDISNTN